MSFQLEELHYVSALSARIQKNHHFFLPPFMEPQFKIIEAKLRPLSLQE